MNNWVDHERSQAGLPPRKAGRVLTGVSGHFSAAHRAPADDPLGNGGALHGHTWKVTAWFDTNGGDVRCYKAALDTVLRLWDHTELPPELSWGEDIARAVGTINNCVEVLVERPLEGFSARWLAG